MSLFLNFYIPQLDSDVLEVDATLVQRIDHSKVLLS
jgi:hypothetical protein